MPSAIPAWAAPHVNCECRSERNSALFTNNVNGLTGQLGCNTVKKGMIPCLDSDIAARNACSSGPPFSPIVRLRCAAFAPSPAHASAYQTLFVLSIDCLLSIIVHYNGSHRLAGLQCLYSMVDLLQREAMRCQFIQFDFTSYIKVKNHRHVDMWPRRSIKTPHQTTLLAYHTSCWQRQLTPFGRDTYHNDRATRSRHLPALPHSPRQADCLETIVHTHTTGQLTNGLEGINLRRVNNVGCAKSSCALQLRWVEINRNDHCRACQLRSLHDVQAHPSRSNDGHRTARSHLRGIDRRPHTGHDGTANQSGLV